MSRENIGIQQFPPATQSKWLEILEKFKEEIAFLFLASFTFFLFSVSLVLVYNVDDFSYLQYEELRPSLVSLSRLGFTLNIIETPGLIEGGYLN